MNLMMLLEMASAGFADRVAVTDGEESLTYEQLFASAGAAARQIQESGAKHLALLDTSSPAVPVALFASAWAGVPFVPLNYRLTDEELQRLTAQISPALLVTDAERTRSLGGIEGIEVIERGAFLAEAASGESGGPSWGWGRGAIRSPRRRGPWIRTTSQSCCSRAGRPDRRRLQ